MSKIEETKDSLKNKKTKVCTAVKLLFATTLTMAMLLSVIGCGDQLIGPDTSLASTISMPDPASKEGILIDNFKALILTSLGDNRDQIKTEDLTDLIFRFAVNGSSIDSVYIISSEHLDVLTGEMTHTKHFGVDYKTKNWEGSAVFKVSEECANNLFEVFELKTDMDKILFSVNDNDLGSLDDEQFNALQAIYDNMILLSKEYTKEEIEKYLKDSFTNILRPIVAYAYRANPELIEPEFVSMKWSTTNDVLEKITEPDLGIYDNYVLLITYEEEKISKAYGDPDPISVPLSKEIFDLLNFKFGRFSENTAFLFDLREDKLARIDNDQASVLASVLREIDTTMTELIEKSKSFENQEG